MVYSQTNKHFVEVSKSLKLSGVRMILALCFLFTGTTARAQVYANSDELLQDYNEIDEVLLSTNGEIAKVQDFVFSKDVATFTFSDGHILLRRPVAGRPTVAIFVGKGNVSIPIPLEVERRHLETMAGDTVVEETFNVCYIRFADNLDSLLRDRFAFRSGRLSPHDSRLAKKAQGDHFFKPLARHSFDNYFQLLRSAHNRPADGFFWAKFNRFVFSYDPSRAEEICIHFDREPTSIVAFTASQFPRENRIDLDPRGSIGVQYPTVCVKQHTKMELGGSTGYKILSAKSRMSLLINKDSTRFLTTFLHDNLKVDSVWCAGQPVAYQRRRDFKHLGIALPESFVKGDTINVIIKYHGERYGNPFPGVENPSKFPHTLSVTVPRKYNYMFSAIADTVDHSDRFVTFDVKPTQYLNAPYFVARATGWDTLSTSTSFGLPVHCTMPETQNLTKITKKYSLLDDETRECFLRALEYMYNMLGYPPLATDLYVSSGGRSIYSRTGYIRMPTSISVRDEYGGFSLVAAKAAAGQWFSTTAKPATYREKWILEALPVYLALMFVEAEAGTEAYTRNLSFHGETVLRVVDKREDTPLACGIGGWSSKGIWVIHMLRNLMNTTSSTKDQSFKAWLQDVVREANAGPFTNKDLQDIAERHFGYDLQCFFNKWLYGTGIVEYDITYSISQGDDGYYLNMDVITSGVAREYLAPVLVRLEAESSPMLFNAFITPKVTKYQYGPFNEEPTKFLFNRYLSVLSREKISEIDDTSP